MAVESEYMSTLPFVYMVQPDGLYSIARRHSVSTPWPGTHVERQRPEIVASGLQPRWASFIVKLLNDKWIREQEVSDAS